MRSRNIVKFNRDVPSGDAIGESVGECESTREFVEVGCPCIRVFGNSCSQNPKFKSLHNKKARVKKKTRVAQSPLAKKKVTGFGYEARLVCRFGFCNA